MSKFELKALPLSVTAQSFSLCQLLSRVDSEDAILRSIDGILGDIAKNCEVNAVAFMVRGSRDGLARLAGHFHTVGIPPDEKKKVSAFLSESITADLHQAARCVRRDDVRHDIMGDRVAGQRTTLVSMLAVPMTCGGQLIGTFVAFRAEIGGFCDDDELYFQKIATLLAEDLQNASAYLRLARDPVTGFYNRRVFYEVLMQECARARRYQAPLSTMIFEVDSPILLDPFLKRFSQRVISETRQSDIIARAADSTFVFLQPMTSAQSSVEAALRIVAHFQQNPIIVNENAVPFGMSVGISALLQSDDDGTAMLMRADQAVAIARKRGPNMIEVHKEHA